ncbi:unnamed protein product [Caenorhabditis brenneri]
MDNLRMLLDYILLVRQCPHIAISLMDDERREELKRMWNALYDKYGRNFINYMRALLNNEKWFDFDLPDNTFLARPTRQNELARFVGMTLEHNEYFMSVLYHKLFDEAEVLLGDQQKIAQEIGTVGERDDYYEWSNQIENLCRQLNDKYPGFFCNRLHEFLTMAHKRLIEDNKVKPDPEPPIQRVEEENKEANWDELMKQIDDYKYNHNCGYMYGVLQFWLDNMVEGMKASLSHTLPRYYPEKVTSIKLADMERMGAVRTFLQLFDDDYEEPQVKKMKMSSDFMMKPFPNSTNGFSNMPKKPKESLLQLNDTTSYRLLKKSFFKN